jgi:hypothetical protein
MLAPIAGPLPSIVETHFPAHPHRAGYSVNATGLRHQAKLVLDR